jgi:hypothetical protein
MELFFSFSLAAVTSSITWPEPGVTLVCRGRRFPSARTNSCDATANGAD